MPAASRSICPAAAARWFCRPPVLSGQHCAAVLLEDAASLAKIGVHLGKAARLALQRVVPLEGGLSLHMHIAVAVGSFKCGVVSTQRAACCLLLGERAKQVLLTCACIRCACVPHKLLDAVAYLHLLLCCVQVVHDVRCQRPHNAGRQAMLATEVPSHVLC
jgi:hypothetical protein